MILAHETCYTAYLDAIHFKRVLNFGEGQLLPALGFEPLLGRNFTNDEAESGRNLVAILSDSFWRRQFAANPSIIESLIYLDGIKFQVIGVLPPRFLLMPRVDVLVPFVLNESQFRYARSAQNYDVYAELVQGVSFKQALAETQTVAARLRQQYPDADKDQDYALVSLRTELVGQIRPALLLLMAAVGVVLIIACANISIMLLARAAGRQRELAIRAALGASRRRIFQQLLSESLLLSFLGAALGLIIGMAVLRTLISIAPVNLPEVSQIGLSPPVLAFTIAIAVVAAVLFGCGPALQATSGRFWSALSTRGLTGSGQTTRIRAVLVVTESALALILTVAAALLLKSFLRLTAKNPGYSTERVLTFGVSLDPDHRQLNAATVLLQQIHEKLSAIPGVQATGASSNLPMERGGDLLFTIAGRPTPTDRATAPEALWRFVTPGYFQALGLHLLQGRWFSDIDGMESEPVVIVNRALTSKYFPGDNAMGQHLYIGGPFASTTHDIGEREIVGIIGDSLTVSLYESDPPTMYIPLSQLPPTIATKIGGVNMVVSAVEVETLRRPVSSALHDADSELAISHMRTVKQLIEDYIAPERFSFILLAVFGGLGVLLAEVGIYGVVTYTVEERRGEIGVRMACGARRSDIVLVVVGSGMKLVLLGLAIGFAFATLLIGRLVRGFIYGVSATDPVILTAVGLMFIFVALVAHLVPTLRAVRVDPAEVLRSE